MAWFRLAAQSSTFVGSTFFMNALLKVGQSAFLLQKWLTWIGS